MSSAQSQQFTDPQPEPGLRGDHGPVPGRHRLGQCVHLLDGQRDDPLPVVVGQPDPHHRGVRHQPIQDGAA